MLANRTEHRWKMWLVRWTKFPFPMKTCQWHASIECSWWAPSPPDYLRNYLIVALTYTIYWSQYLSQTEVMDNESILGNTNYTTIDIYSQLKINRRFGGPYRLQHQGPRIRNQHESVCLFHAGSCLAYSSTMNMKATSSFETSVNFQRTTRHYIPEDRTLHNHRCENITSYIYVDWF
jgi:hypothetical protein